MTAAGADEAGEAGGKVPATAEGLDGGDGFRPERAHSGAALFFVKGEEIVPGPVDDVPARGEARGASRVVDGWGGGHPSNMIIKTKWANEALRPPRGCKRRGRQAGLRPCGGRRKHAGSGGCC